MSTVMTCESCRRDIVQTPDGWSDGVRANPLLCISAPELSHKPAAEVTA